jgi:hypothetical protein
MKYGASITSNENYKRSFILICTSQLLEIYTYYERRQAIQFEEILNFSMQKEQRK